MRIGGLASGMDVDKLVSQLMEAERMPLQRMEQDQTELTWKRDAFRDVNKKLSELDDMMLDMKMSGTYNPKSVSSSQESAVTATGSPSANNGTYNIEVTKLAKTAVNSSQESIGFDADKTFADLEADGELNLTDEQKSFEFYTYKDNGESQTHSYDIKDNESLNNLLNRISNDDNNVRALYDGNSDKVIMETTRTGDYNTDNSQFLGAEIAFDSTTDSSFLTDVLHIKNGEQDPETGDWSRVESGGKDAEFKYNGIDMTSHSNSYELGGVNFEFKDTTDGAANLTVNNNVEESFDSIMNFVDKYNEVVDKLNGSQQEEINRDYPPLTDKQKEEMSENEIELWNEKAKSGILRGESAISNGLYSMRNSWYSEVDTDGAYSSLTQVGITTSSNYLDGGKLQVDEQELKDALSDDPDSVYKLFSNNSEGSSRGIINRVEDSLDSTIGQIEDRAGKGTDTLENYSIGKRMKDVNSRISDFEDRLVRVEDRYWSQFTEMEQAIQRMNQQSAQLQNQLGGGM